MNIFIEIYHKIRDLFTFPAKLFKGSKMKKSANTSFIPETSENSETEIEIKKAKQVKREVERMTFDYEVVNSQGQTIKSSFDAETESEVRAFLINEGYKIVKITPRKKFSLSMELGSSKLSTGELTFALTQLSTYIKSGIPLIDSVRILAKQTVKASKRKIYERIVYDLVIGENFSAALEHQQKVFPRLLVNMVKTAEMTGDLATVLDEMSEYYTEIEKTKKQMISALTYPAVIFLFSIAVVVFCLLNVVPTFVNMYSASGTELPTVTQITLNISDFLQKSYLYIILIIGILAFTYHQTYQNVKSFRKLMQTLYMKLPVIGDIIIYKEVMMFTKTFASLINHNVNITQTMEVLSNISNNEIYKDIVHNTVENLKKGGRISDSFRGQWAFPIVAYEMLVTGESTGQLGLMMEKVADHYSNLHKTSVSTIKSLVEPITIIFLAMCVGFILISMFIPMFESYGTIG